VTGIPWDIDAEAALQRVPRLVRPLARRKIEQRVRRAGGGRVRLADYQEAEARFQAVRGGRTDQQLEAVLPTDNRPGVPMVVVESCHHEVSACPNALLDTSRWRRAVEDWVAAEDISERLRRRLPDGRILFHHKLRIAIAGCPNGCSRPQIADLAVVGHLRPVFHAQACTACGLCAEACPDQAITVDQTARADRDLCQGCRSCAAACEFEAVELPEPWGEVVMGGKLGRHPHLAVRVGLAPEPAQAVELFSGAVERYLQNARPGERFAAWWIRSEKGGR